MEKSTLIEILKTFSKEELARFSDFTVSPYHNKKSNVVKLYGSLRKFAPDFPAEKITKEGMWKIIFPGKKYNYGIMKNLIYDLNGLALNFLELERHCGKPFECDINLLEQYKLRSLKSLFVRKLKESRNNIAKSPVDNLTFYYSYILEYTEMSYIDYEYLLKSKDSDYYAELNKSLTIFYFSNLLYHNANNIQLSFNKYAYVDKDFHLKIMKHYEDSSIKDAYPDILYLAYITASEPHNKEGYYKLKNLFFNSYKIYSKGIQYDLAVNLLNFCRNNAVRGNKDFLKDEFTYIKLMVEEKLYQSTSFGWIDQYLFMSSVACACRAGEFAWAEKFIEEHKHELMESKREQYTNFAYTTLNLRRGRFQDALHYLSKCRNVDDGDKLNIRVFEFNAYYELGYYDEFKALADTTNHFLRKDKIFSKDEHIVFKNYVNTITKLMDYKFNVGNKQKDKGFLPGVLNFILENKMLNKNWLLGKIEELKSIK